MKEPSLLQCLFIYENDSYGCPIYRTNKLNFDGIKYLFKKIGKQCWKLLKELIKIIIPAIIGYFFGKGV